MFWKHVICWAVSSLIRSPVCLLGGDVALVPLPQKIVLLVWIQVVMCKLLIWVCYLAFGV